MEQNWQQQKIKNWNIKCTFKKQIGQQVQSPLLGLISNASPSLLAVKLKKAKWYDSHYLINSEAGTSQFLEAIKWDNVCEHF